MARLNIVIDDDLDRAFRISLANRGLGKKGDISKEIQRLIKRSLKRRK
jgi:hypothetical protein